MIEPAPDEPSAPPEPTPAPEPPPAPEPASQSEQARNSIEVKVARIAAIAATAGAFLAVGAAVVGAVIAGYYTSSTADRQIAAQAEQATVDSLRDERQEAYSAFSLAEAELSAAEEQVYGSSDGSIVFDREDGGPTTPEDFQAINDALTGLQQNYFVIQLIGSNEAATTAQTLLNVHLQLRNTSSLYYFQAELETSDTVYYDSIGLTLFRLRDLRSEYLESARHDLGSG